MASEDELLIDARVSPQDIEVVRAGLEAKIILTAYSQRAVNPVKGTVREVSADALTDPVTGESYFLARVTVQRDSLEEVVPGAELSPGMPAEVAIITGEQTFLDYMLAPVRSSLRRSFREG